MSNDELVQYVRDERVDILAVQAYCRGDEVVRHDGAGMTFPMPNPTMPHAYTFNYINNRSGIFLPLSIKFREMS